MDFVIHDHPYREERIIFAHPRAAVVVAEAAYGTTIAFVIKSLSSTSLPVAWKAFHADQVATKKELPLLL